MRCLEFFCEWFGSLDKPDLKKNLIRSCFQVFVTSFQFGELTKTISNKFIKTNKDRETKVLKNNG